MRMQINLPVTLMEQLAAVSGHTIRPTLILLSVFA
jgi:hypothetical protein